MKKTASIVIVLLLTTIAVGVALIVSPEDSWVCESGQWVKHGNPTDPMPTEPCSSEGVADFTECVAAGYPVMESYPRQCMTPEGTTYTEDIDGSGMVDLIRVSTPRPGEAVRSPLVIEGEARGTWFFEASFPVKLYDSANMVIATGIAQAQGDWMTEDFVPFRAELTFIAPASPDAILVLEKDNPSGLPENDKNVRIPLLIEGGSEETMTVKAYFGNSVLDPEVSCNKVFAVEREIPKTESVARAALLELFKGTTVSEEGEGFFSSINDGVVIQSLVIEDGKATVDLNEQLEYQVGGSCKVAAIRAQIVETLKQFTNVKTVVISIDGRVEDILQP